MTETVLIGRAGQIITSGDHMIVLIDVEHVEHKDSCLPALSFYRGRFAAPVVTA